ncbi:hypothetical protein M0802_011736 [Mischocyttarus mexicanus]|nr:hypothetical protein M0802_011736 [Mischocyttarus mexicanus]
MAKTPISILQEFGMKEGFLPEYTLVSAKVINNLNVFKVQVKYKDLLAEGEALNKKEAKHNAAKNMIILIQNTAHTIKIEEIVPLEESISERKQILSLKESIFETKPILPLKESISEAKPILPLKENISETKSILPLKESIYETKSILSLKNIDDINVKLNSLKINGKIEDTTNYVGKLQEYCCINRLVEPQYELSDVSGLPHIQKFTMSCKLGTVIEKATSNTKKQAKHLSAKLILDRLKNPDTLITPEKCDMQSTDTSVKEGNDEDILTKLGIRLLKFNNNSCHKDVEEKYRKLTNKSCIKTDPKNNTCNIINYHFFIKNTVCSNASINKEEELHIIYQTITNFKVVLSKIINDNGITKLPFDHILIYIKEKLKLDIEKKYIKCKDPLLNAIAYKISAPIPVVQFGTNKILQIADAIALNNILDTIMIYLK